MRSIPLILAAFAFSAPAFAQSWEEYSYPEYAISVAFPASPQIETTTYQIADGRSVPARVYSVRQDKGEFKMTVAELANTGIGEKAVIDHAIKVLSQDATVKVNVPARIYRVYGRQLTIDGADGSRSMVAIFRSHGAAFSDPGQSASRWERVRADSLSAILSIRPRRLEPLAGGSSSHSRSLPWLGRRSQRRGQSR